MPFQTVILWTDWLIFLLVGVIVLAAAAQWFKHGIERAFDFRRIHNTRRSLLASEARAVMQ